MSNPLKNLSIDEWNNLRNYTGSTSSSFYKPNKIAIGLTKALTNTSNSSISPENTDNSFLKGLDNVIPGDISILEGLGNAITGNADFQRQFGLQAYNNSFNAEQAQITRDFNMEENQKQRDWYERMANTSYSRQVADLQASGLNPYVSLSGGAPVAYGSSANASAPTATAVGSQHSGQGIQALASVANSALSAYTHNNVATANNFTKIITTLLSMKK